MAFFNKKPIEEEKNYTRSSGELDSDAQMKEKMGDRRKSRRNWLIALGVIAVVATITMPFAIGLAVTATGATAATLTGVGVSAALLALGIDVGFIGAYIATSAKRRAGRDARRINKARESKTALNTTNLKSRVSTREVSTFIAENVSDAEIRVKKADITRAKIVDSVAFGPGADKTIVDKFRNGAALDGNEIEHLLKYMSPSDKNAEAQFGGKVEYSKPVIMGPITVKVGSVEQQYPVAMGKVYTEEAKQTFQAAVSILQEGLATYAGVAPEDVSVTQTIIVRDAKKGPEQIAKYDAKNKDDSIEALAAIAAVREKGNIENKQSTLGKVKEKVASVFGR